MEPIISANIWATCTLSEWQKSSQLNGEMGKIVTREFQTIILLIMFLSVLICLYYSYYGGDICFATFKWSDFWEFKRFGFFGSISHLNYLQTPICLIVMLFDFILENFTSNILDIYLRNNS